MLNCMYTTLVSSKQYIIALECHYYYKLYTGKCVNKSHHSKLILELILEN